MTIVRACLALSLALVGLAATVPVQGADYYPTRQYYGNWQKHQSHNYYYRKYYYKPSQTYSGFKHHYVVYHPSRKNYYYYYNPYKKAYWGRCPNTSSPEYDGKGVYSQLPEEFRKPQLSQIAEASFPKPSDPPPIPESTDKVPLDLPPDDLPEDLKPTVTAPVGE